MSEGEKAPTKAKAKAKAPAKKKVEPTHPTFKVMVVSAVTILKERNGSSRQAIQKHIESTYKVGDNSKKFVNTALCKCVKEGVFLQKKGTGASGSFKLAKVEKKVVKKKPAKKAAAVKKVAVKKTPKKKPAVAKKKTPKKKTPKKPAAKKPAAKKATPKKKATKKKTAKK